MRILVITVDYPPIEGGISTLCLQVTRALARAGHEVTVAAPRFSDMEAFDAAEPVHVVRVPGYGLGWFRLFPLLRSVQPLLRDCDLVLAINVAYGGVIGRLCGRPYVVFAYGYEFLKFRGVPVLSFLLRRVYAGACFVAAISRYTRDQLVDFGVKADHIHIILPGADPRHTASASQSPPMQALTEEATGRFILSVGRFIPRKEHLTLVCAMPRILEACPNTRLVMAGRGPLREACLDKAAKLGIEAFVECPGYVEPDTLDALYRDCALFALPSGEGEGGHVEGFGLVFTEAHAHGKAVVAGRSGGVTDAVINGETGILVRPGDVDATASAIIKLLNDPEYARQLGKNGRARVEKELNWEAFTSRLMALVEAHVESAA